MPILQSYESPVKEPIATQLPAWGVSVVESRHADDFQMVLARHDFWQLLYVLDGAGELRTETDTYSLLKGDAIIVPVGALHGTQDLPEHPITLYAVNIAPRLLQPFEALQPLFTSCRRLRQPALSTLMPDVLRRLLFEQALQKPGCDVMMIGLALQIVANLVHLTTLSAASSTKAATLSDLPTVSKNMLAQARVAAYIQEVEQRFYEVETLEQVATRLGMSRRHFSELFRKQTGSSWLPYIRDLRLQHAKRLLGNSQRSVQSIAFECGFEDVSSFYRTFKDKVGTSPNQWRIAHAEPTQITTS
jgi:AraC family L-rhamnose operon regulatory protein RhaS